MSETYLRIREYFTLSEIMGILRRRSTVIIFTFLFFLFLTILYVEFIDVPLYEATAKVKVPTGSAGFGTLSGAAALILGGAATSPDIATQQEIILSRPVLEEVVKRTGLIELQSKKGESEKSLALDHVVNSLKSGKFISISSIKNSPILQIKVYNKDRETAKRILEELLNVYTSTYVKLSKDEKTAQLEVLEKQVPELEREINEISEKLKVFKMTKSVSPSQEGELYVSAIATLTKEKYETESEIQSTKEAISKLEKQIGLLQADSKKLGYTPTSELLEKYRADLTQLQAKYSYLVQQYTEEYPDVKSIKGQIKQLETEIDKEIQRIVSSKIESPSPLLQELYTQLLQNKLKLPILETKLSTLIRAIEETEAKLKKLPLLEQEYLNLERDYKIKQTIYSAVVQKYEELKLNAAGSEVNKPQVIDPPYVPEQPVKPNKRVSIAVGSLAGLFIGVLAALIRDTFDKKIRSLEQLTGMVSVPLIVQMGDDEKKASRIVLSHILNSFPSDRKIALLSPDSKPYLERTWDLICGLFEEYKLPFERVSLECEALIIHDLIDRLQSTPERFYILKAPVLAECYIGYILAQKSDGVVLVMKLNETLKANILKTLRWCSENRVKVYGIIVF